MDEEENVEPVQTEDNNTTTAGDRKGFNITALILGIISIVSFCWWYVSIPTGIVAIIFSIAGKNNAGRGMGIAGMVCGIIGVILSIALIALAMLGLAALGEAIGY